MWLRFESTGFQEALQATDRNEESKEEKTQVLYIFGEGEREISYAHWIFSLNMKRKIESSKKFKERKKEKEKEVESVGQF